MSIDCSHGSFGEHPRVAPHGDCPDCRMARIESLLERLATALAPTLDDIKAAAYQTSVERLKAAQQAKPVRTNAIAGPGINDFRGLR